MTRRFAGQAVLVTGAGSGIGRGVAARLSAEGAHLILQGRTRAKLEETAALLDGSAEIIAGDVSVPADIDQTVRYLSDSRSHLNVLVNNAGIARFGPSDSLERDDLEATLAINFTGLVHLTRGVAPLLRQAKPGGVVINISSTLGLSPVAGSLAYSASKAAVVSATATLAAEWGPVGSIVSVPGLSIRRFTMAADRAGRLFRTISTSGPWTIPCDGSVFRRISLRLWRIWPPAKPRGSPALSSRLMAG